MTEKEKKEIKDIAHDWLNEGDFMVNPDKCSHPKAAEAMQALEKLYKWMKK